MATHLGTGHGAFFHALHLTRTHDVLCHCKTYVALFSTHLTKISTWILNNCTETNEKFYLHSTQYIQGRKWKKICQVGSNKKRQFHLIYNVGYWNHLKFTEEGLLQQNMDTWEILVKENPLRTSQQSQGCPQPRSKCSITQYYSISKSAIQNMRYCRNFTKAGLKLSQYMVATQESKNSRFCS